MEELTPGGKVILEKIAKELGIKHKKPIPYPATYEIIEAASSKYIRTDDRLLFNWLYLTGQRISEALQTRRSDIKVRTLGEKPFMVVDSITLKNRDQPRREISVPLFGLEESLSKPTFATIENTRPELPLFTYSRQMSFNHLSKVSIPCKFIVAKTRERFEAQLPVYPHYLRHCRASHLSTEHGWDSSKLMNYFGWASPSMPNLYASSNWRVFAKGFLHD